MLFGATFKSNFKNVDVIRRGVNSRFVSPGRIHFFGYKISSISLAKADAFSFTEPDFPLAEWQYLMRLLQKQQKISLAVR